MARVRSDARRGTPLLLADQLCAWLHYRDGQPVQQVALHLRRTVREARTILFGAAQ